MILVALFGQVRFAVGRLADAETTPSAQAFLVAVAATFFAVMSIYSTWYLLDCLYADRKDRSMLFWKSLPISDTDHVVMSKLATALIVIPAVYFRRRRSDRAADGVHHLGPLRVHRSAAPCGTPICGCRCRSCGCT